MNNSAYIEYRFEVKPAVPAVEILVAELGYAGFESFVETEKGVSAYIQKSEWREDILKDIQILSSKEFYIIYFIEEIEQTNWNETWEKTFHPIIVEDKCTVRAPFHNAPEYGLDIIIEPKMSFGTGHHETTYMMMQFLLKENVKNKTVLDMGCGTGVLAILAEKMGACSVEAVDIDEWSYENSIENCERNSCQKITVFQGDAALLNGRNYDVIVANINRNILVRDMGEYASSLNQGGMFLLSGFYKEDIPLIIEACEQLQLKFEESLEKGKWVALKFLN